MDSRLLKGCIRCIPTEIKPKDKVKNYILEDKYFYYRYWFRGTCNFGIESKNKMYKEKYKKIQSFGPNFLQDTYNQIKL